MKVLRTAGRTRCRSPAHGELSVWPDIARRVCFLADGQIIEDAPPAELFTAPKDERTQKFLRRIVEAGRL
jgi:polar amino acid transport system ATP-binding protein